MYDRLKPLLLPVLMLVLVVGAGTLRAEDTEEADAPQPYEIGQKVEAFSGAGYGETTVSLADLAITRERAEAAVREIAAEYGAAADAALDTKIASLDGVMEEGEVDELAVVEFIGKVGMRFGLVASEEAALGMESLGSLVSWIEGAAAAPTLLVVFSPRCPMCKNCHDERINEIVAETGIRVLGIAGNYNDDPEQVEGYMEGNGYPWTVILDPEQKIVDLLGAERTPHVFLLDGDNVLRDRGAIDNDFTWSLEEEERELYLLDAIEAVKAGEDVEVSETEPSG
ncbi:MAG: redoxin family protein [Planctomycetota bacterium]|jgi:hypothetical protein